MSDYAIVHPDEADDAYAGSDVPGEFRRLTDALGPDADPVAIRTLEMATSGALLQVGTGHLAYDDVPRLLAETAELVLGGALR